MIHWARWIHGAAFPSRGALPWFAKLLWDGWRRQAANLQYVRNEESLAPSGRTNPITPLVDLLQKARSLKVNILTESDVVKAYGVKYRAP